MNLSTPIYNLKRRAKKLSRESKIPLHSALNILAQREGFSNWGLLAHHFNSSYSPIELSKQFLPGQLILLGARPGHGKTLMALNLIAKSIKSGRPGNFFTLEYSWSDTEKRLESIGEEKLCANEKFSFDGSDAICASYIIEQLADVERETLVVIDYLQLLDQKRSNPELSIQIQDLKSFAKRQGIIVVCISQIDRSFVNDNSHPPTRNDVRLPNPLDLSMFDATCFLHNGKIDYTTA